MAPSTSTPRPTNPFPASETMSDKPLSPDLQETLNTLFDDEDEREEVAAFLRKHYRDWETDRKSVV